MNVLFSSSSRRSSRPGLAWLGVLLAASLWAGAALAQPAGDQKKGKALFEQGLALSDEGKWSEALDVFQKSDEAAPSATVQFNIAATLRALGRYVEANQRLNQLLSPAAKLPLKPGLRKDAEQLQREVKEKIVVLRLQVDPEGAEVQVDGSPLKTTAEGKIELDPGKHVFVVKKEGYDTTSVTKTLGPSDAELRVLAPRSRVIETVVEKPVEVQVPVEVDRPFYTRFWFWATTGAVLVGAGAVIYVVASPHASQKEPTVQPSVSIERPIPTLIRF
jgi:hypothetical protein